MLRWWGWSWASRGVFFHGVVAKTCGYYRVHVRPKNRLGKFTEIIGGEEFTSDAHINFVIFWDRVAGCLVSV